MTKWEYKIVMVENYEDTIHCEESILWVYGREGWELVSVVERQLKRGLADEVIYKTEYVFKKPIEE